MPLSSVTSAAGEGAAAWAVAAAAIATRAANPAPRLLKSYTLWCCFSASVLLISLRSLVLILAPLLPYWGPYAQPVSVSYPSNSHVFKSQMHQQHPERHASCPHNFGPPLSPSSCAAPLRAKGGVVVIPSRAHRRQSGARPAACSRRVVKQPVSLKRCPLLLVTAVARRGESRGSSNSLVNSLTGYWHRVSSPEAKEGLLWTNELFVSDRGMLLSREEGNIWKVRDAVFGGGVVAYIEGKKSFPARSKWWVQQQQQQQQQQQWELEKSLTGECLETAEAEGRGFSRDILFGFKAANSARCHHPPTETGKIPSVHSPSRSFSHTWGGGSHEGSHHLTCAELVLMPKRLAALQQLFLSASSAAFRGEQQQQLVHQLEDTPTHHHRHQQQQCSRLHVSGGAGPGALGCTGRFSFLGEDRESSVGSIYFSLSLDTRIMFLTVRDGLVVCGGESMVLVAAGIFKDSKSDSRKGDGVADRQDSSSQQQKQLFQLLEAGRTVELQGRWLQDGGEYANQAMHLRCETPTKVANPTGCRDLRARGFKNAVLNGVWKLRGFVNGRPHYVKCINRINVAVTAAPGGFSVNGASWEDTPSLLQQQQQELKAAGKGVLHLYHTSQGLWVISPHVQQENLVDSVETGRNASTLIVLALSRSEALEPPSGAWSVFRGGGETDRGAQTEACGVGGPGTQDAFAYQDNKESNQRNAHFDINVVRLSCLGDVI